MTMWEWWAVYYHKAVSLGAEFKSSGELKDGKEYMKRNMQWGFF